MGLTVSLHGVYFLFYLKKIIIIFWNIDILLISILSNSIIFLSKTNQFIITKYHNNNPIHCYFPVIINNWGHFLEDDDSKGWHLLVKRILQKNKSKKK